MSGSTIPVRIAHGWAFAWLDFYQAPVLAYDSVTSEVKGFFTELVRGREEYPGAVTQQSAKHNKLGRPHRYGNEDKTYIFGNPF
jgi:hypothetical protein